MFIDTNYLITNNLKKTFYKKLIKGTRLRYRKVLR